MLSIGNLLNINSKTTWFASPAESYVDKRLDINELIIKNVHTTFYFRYGGPNTLGVNKNDILVIDREEVPKDDDLVIIVENSNFNIRKFQGQENLWGKVCWILKKL